jgi:hypothetical protein
VHVFAAAGAELMQTAPVSDSMHVPKQVQWTANAIAIVVKLIVVSQCIWMLQGTAVEQWWQQERLQGGCRNCCVAAPTGSTCVA